MYKLDERINIKLRFLDHDEYGAKIYEDCFGTKFIWYSKSTKLENKDWFEVRTKLYVGLNENGEVEHYTLFNPREVK